MGNPIDLGQKLGFRIQRRLNERFREIWGCYESVYQDDGLVGCGRLYLVGWGAQNFWECDLQPWKTEAPSFCANSAHICQATQHLTPAESNREAYPLIPL